MRTALIIALFTTTIADAAVPPNHRNFVACPIVRDTATVPCWLARASENRGSKALYGGTRTGQRFDRR